MQRIRSRLQWLRCQRKGSLGPHFKCWCSQIWSKYCVWKHGFPVHCVLQEISSFVTWKSQCVSDVSEIGTILKHSLITNGGEFVLPSCFARIFKIHYCVILTWICTKKGDGSASVNGLCYRLVDQRIVVQFTVGILLFSRMSGHVYGGCCGGELYAGVKWPVCEANHPPSSSVEVSVWTAHSRTWWPTCQLNSVPKQTVRVVCDY